MENSEHLHTGIVSFAYIGIAAVVFLNLWRLAAARAVLSGNPTIASVGKAAGALVTFGS